MATFAASRHEQTAKDRLFPFERSAITRVFLGPRISPDDEATIRQLAALHHPVIPILKRTIDDAEAKEENVGVEQLHSFEQFLYWMKRTK
jgi:hypothetical protein